MDHSDNDCLMVTVMTHGDEKTIASYDQDYKIGLITSKFTDDRCPTLIGKPRIFFIQACRGERLDHGFIPKNPRVPHKLRRSIKNRNDVSDVAIPFVMNKIHADFEFEEKVFCPPIHKDFLLVRSAMQGYFSFRNPTTGSWFIQDLCSELEQNGTSIDILNLLTHVNWKVSERESVGTVLDRKKQILCISTMLSKLLIFNAKPRDALAIIPY